jgi:hypothetical protein
MSNFGPKWGSGIKTGTQPAPAFGKRKQGMPRKARPLGILIDRLGQFLYFSYSFPAHHPENPA